MATIKISSLKTPAYSAIDTRNSPMVQCKPSNFSGTISEYGTQLSNNPNIISGTIITKNNPDNPPKAKIRIHKKNTNNKPLVNLDENLFSRNGNNFLTTKAIIDEANPHRFERNYSYIEAMKEDFPYNPKPVKAINKKSDTLPQSITLNNGRNQKVEVNVQQQQFPDKNKKPPLSAASTPFSPSTSSSSSTASSIISQKQRTVTDSTSKHVNNSPAFQKPGKTVNNNGTSNLAKSASQSSILAIFKNTFSPFAIRKWRSKSRDKIIHKTEFSAFDSIDNKLKPPINKNRPQSPEMSNHQINNQHKSIKNSHLSQKAANESLQAFSNDGHKYQKNQLTPNQIRLKNKNNVKKNSDDEAINVMTNIVLNDNLNNSIKFEKNMPDNNDVKDIPSTVLNPESPRSFLTNATNKSKTTNSSMSSSLSSSNSSFVLPCLNGNALPKAQQPPVTSSLKEINTFLSNLSLKLPQNSERQKSERINLTCMLNGYISQQDNNEQFNSQSTTNIEGNMDAKINGKIESGNNIQSGRSYLNNSLDNRDLMNKSADVLNSARFYDLKKRVTMSNTNNRDSYQSNQPQEILQENINNNLKDDSFENRILPKVSIEGNEKKEGLIETANKLNEKDVDIIDTTHSSLLKPSPEPIQTEKTTQISNPTLRIINNENTTTTAQSELIESDSIKDGNYYLKLLDDNTKLLNDLCTNYQKYTEPTNIEYVTNEDSLGEIQTAIGKSQLLVNKKFKQFRGLCVKNLKDKSEDALNNDGEFVTLDGDLAGFWDMVCLQIEDIIRLFKKLEEMKANNWELVRKTKPTAVKKPLLSNNNQNKTTTTITSSKNGNSKKNTDAARLRLIEAKKKAAALKLKNQNNDIEIFE